MQLKAWMQEALRLAEKGRLSVRSNPMVGALVVKNGKVIARGYHHTFGGPHAEVVALKKAGKRAKGAALLITLEPCSTHGKTPPCTDLILKSGIQKVVVATLDPTRANKQKGIQVLRKAGLKVQIGVLKKEAEELNRTFFYFHRQHRPYVILKLAQSLDGKIATHTSDSRWITSSKARKCVHELRAQARAIVVGKNTLLHDNPHLTVRGVKGTYQPLRVVVSRDLKFPKNLNLFHSAKVGPVAIITCGTGKSFIQKLKNRDSVWIITVPCKKGRVDLKKAIQRLGALGITSILIEGGGELAASFLEEKLVNEVYWFIAKKIIGGRNAVTSVEGEGVSRVKQAILLNRTSIEDLGEEFLIRGFLK